MPEAPKCPQCGAPLPGEGWEGLCPRCVVRVALEMPASPSPGEEGQVTSHPSPITTHVLTEHIGMMIGRYKLLQQIGEGGFGIVFMAEQTEPVQRKVALKVIKAGMDTREVIARFEAERQALALMDHPNIAQVLDGGTIPHSRNRPYFVMELVRGLPITGYCDQANLGTRERLELFIKVCRAVQHAHQKGVIHRDLKPSNVLVTLHDGEPVPKVIDFGVAKALGQKLTDKTLFTRFEQMIGTPAYMSPEQAALGGLDIDTRSDIYSLGVMLYELLTGVTPFDTETLREAALDEIRRMIREIEPAKPSTRLTDLVAADVRRLTTSATEKDRACLGRLQQKKEIISAIRGDLDWITMKALEKDRRRRYETVNGLAADVERHLSHEPVVARPPSAAYRFQRTVQRHRVAFAAGTAVLIVLVAGVVISTWQAVRATRAEHDQSRLRAKAQDAHASEAKERHRAEAAVTRLEIERAENLFATENSSRALAYLARLLRQQPTNHVVAERLLSALGQRNFCLPSAPPMQHDPPLSASAYPVPEDESRLKVMARRNSSLRAGQFSPDGQLVVTASRDGTARIWDARSGLPVGAALRHEAGVMWAQFSADGRRVVTASLDHTARVWDCQTGQPILPALRHSAGVFHAAFSSDGRKVLTASADKTVRVWDAQTGQPLFRPLTNHSGAYFATFSPDDTRVLIATTDDMARVWDVSNGVEIASFPHYLYREIGLSFPRFGRKSEDVLTQYFQGRIWDTRAPKSPVVRLEHDSEVHVVQFSPDATLVATGSADNTARVWDAGRGEPVTPPLKHENWLVSAQFSNDGRELLTTASDNTARLWDVSSGQAFSEPLRLGEFPLAAHFSPDRRRMLTITESASAWLWDLRCAQPLAEPLRHGQEVRRAVFSPDGRYLATISIDGNARVWEARTGRPVTGFLKQGGRLHFAEFSPDGRLLAIASQDGFNACVWDVKTGLAVAGPLRHRHNIYSARFSPDGRRLITASTDRTARVWEIPSGQPVVTFQHAEQVNYAEFSPDGKGVLTACLDGTARLWDAREGRELIPPLRHEGEVSCAVFSPDGQRIVTASRDKSARIWSAATGQMLTKPLLHADILYQFNCVRFSPDGTRIATAAGAAGQIWDARTGEPLTLPLKHAGRVNSVRFSPDGRRVVTAGGDGTARVWDVETGHALGEPLPHRARVVYAEFSPDGRWVVTASVDKTARVWEMPPTTIPIPEWLPALAEAVAGQRIDPRDISSVVPVSALFDLKQRIGHPDSSAQNTQSGDGYARWAAWFFAESDNRTLSPSSPVTVSEYVSRRIGESTLESLREAVLLCPTNTESRTRLAIALSAQKPVEKEAAKEQ